MSKRNRDGSRKTGNKGSATEPHKRQVFMSPHGGNDTKHETGVFDRKIGDVVLDRSISPIAFIVDEKTKRVTEVAPIEE